VTCETCKHWQHEPTYDFENEYGLARYGLCQNAASSTNGRYLGENCYCDKHEPVSPGKEAA
jgi:hypothetical protein